MRLLKQKIQVHPVKAVWITWLLLALVTTASLTFLDLALYAPELPVKLRQGEKTVWRVWRPFATDESRFEMSYRRAEDGGLRLHILGDKTQNITGEPVFISLTLNGQTCLYQQNDVSGWNSRVFRPLEPVESGCLLREKSGMNHWEAAVLEVSPKLQGERTRLGMIPPAGSLKQRAENGYGQMAEILFWGQLVWLPFFLFMSLPLCLDGVRRLAKQYHWSNRLAQARQKWIGHWRHKG